MTVTGSRRVIYCVLHYIHSWEFGKAYRWLGQLGVEEQVLGEHVPQPLQLADVLPLLPGNVAAQAEPGGTDSSRTAAVPCCDPHGKDYILWHEQVDLHNKDQHLMSSSRHCDRTLSSAGGAGGGGLPGRGGKALAIRLGSKRRRTSSACKTKQTVSMSHEERHDGTWKAGPLSRVLG